MKQSKGLSGDLKLEYKNTKNRITMSPTTDIWYVPLESVF